MNKLIKRILLKSINKVAKKYSLNEGYKGDWQLEGLSKVLRDVRELNAHVVNACIDEKLNPVSLAPASSFL